MLDDKAQLTLAIPVYSKGVGWDVDCCFTSNNSSMVPGFVHEDIFMEHEQERDKHKLVPQRKNNVV